MWNIAKFKDKLRKELEMMPFSLTDATEVFSSHRWVDHGENHRTSRHNIFTLTYHVQVIEYKYGRTRPQCTLFGIAHLYTTIILILVHPHTSTEIDQN